MPTPNKENMPTLFKAVKFIRKMNNPTLAAINVVVDAITQYLNKTYPHVIVIDAGNDVQSVAYERAAMDLDNKRKSGEYRDGDVLYIAIGGDGTVLSAAREAMLNNDYLMGYNTGNLGFLAEFSPMNAVGVIEDVFAGRNTFVECRSVLKCVLDGGVKFAMNDFVISDAESDKTISYSLSICSKFRESRAGQHTANGVIISTPTGSTAYSLNVGGAILTPDLDVMQILPIAPMSITSRPLIVDGRNRVVVSVKPTNTGGGTHWVNMKADGQKVGQWDSRDGLTFVIESCIDHVNMVHYTGWNYFDVLREKLHWNKPHF
jgi:NAD+ kinase